MSNATNLQLVGAESLLELLFDENSRPSLRWLREQTSNREIPSVKIGRLVFYSPEQVRAALEKRNGRAAKLAA